MLIGAHVSTAGGLKKAVERGLERDCEAIQIFSQSPRAWKPTNHSEQDIQEFKTAVQQSKIDAVVIHAVYLINCASDDPEIREKSLTCLKASLQIGDAIGADCVVLHPGSAKKADPKEAIKRAGELYKEALAESDSCSLYLEDTAGAGGTLGRNFAELAALIDAGGGSDRLGICLDSCHLLASGYDIRSSEGITETLAECEREVGLNRLGCLHVNDSQTPLGSNKDRHANLGEGEIGLQALATLLAEPAFDGLTTILEVPGGSDKSGPRLEDVQLARKLRQQGQAA